MKIIRTLFAVAVLGLAFGCAGGGGAASSAESASYSAPPADSPLAKVTVGLNETEVRTILGEPDNSNAYMTGKAWIPFYYGPDTHRTDWMYKGVGRVVFSRNRWTGGLKVIRVLHNPNELQ